MGLEVGACGWGGQERAGESRPGEAYRKRWGAAMSLHSGKGLGSWEICWSLQLMGDLLGAVKWWRNTSQGPQHRVLSSNCPHSVS